MSDFCYKHRLKMIELDEEVNTFQLILERNQVIYYILNVRIPSFDQGRSSVWEFLVLQILCTIYMYINRECWIYAI